MKLSRSERLLKNLHEVLEVLGVSHRRLAQAAGVTEDGVSKWCLGLSNGKLYFWAARDFLARECRKDGLSLDSVIDEAERRNTEKARLKEQSLS